MTRTKARQGKCRPSEDVCLEHGRPLATAKTCEVNCRHRAREQHNDTILVCGKLKVVKSLRCSSCNEWLPLGPAATDTPEVALERDAIEHWMEFVPYDDSDCCCDGCQKRHLANDIATHKDESP